MSKELHTKLLAQGLLVLSQVGFPIITYPVVTKILGPSGLGKVNFADSLVQTILIVASLGIPIYGIREIAIHKNDKKAQSRIFSELFLLQALIVIPALIIFSLLGLLSQIDPALLIIGAITLTGNFLSCDWFLQGNERFFFLAVRSFIIRAIGAALIWLLIKTEHDYLLYYGILTGSMVVSSIVNLVIIFPSIDFSNRKISIWSHVKKMNWLYGCYILASLYALIDSLLLGWISTSEAVGYYSFGYRLLRMSAMMIATLGVVFVPRIAFHFAAAKEKEVREQISTSLQLVLFLSIPLSIFFFILAPEIVAVFSGSQFHRTISVIQILSPLPILIALSHLTGTQIMLSIKKEKAYFLILLIGCFLNVLLDVIFISQLKEQAPAIANLLVEAFVTAATVIYLRKKNIFPFPLGYFIYCVLSSLLLLPIVYWLRLVTSSPLLTLISSFFITAILYVFLHFKFFPQSFVRKLLSFKLFL